MPINKFILSTETKTEPGFAQDMLDAIEVEYVEPNVYTCRELWQMAGGRATYGGQLIAQSLRAAFYTVPEPFSVHSLHCYFLLPGSLKCPVYYKVEPIRDGRSFCTRSVTAIQNDKVVFINHLSFTTNNKSDTSSLVHQNEMPKLSEPELLLSESERWDNFLSDELTDKERDYVVSQKADIQPMEYRDERIYSAREFMDGTTSPTKHHRRWFKTRGSLGNDQRLHACALAYAADNRLVMTPAIHHGVTLRGLGMMASIDHAMWFHGPAHTDEWHVHDMESPRSNNGRGVSFGKIYSRDGTLVATTAQEGIVRLPNKAVVVHAQEHDKVTPIDIAKSINMNKL